MASVGYITGQDNSREIQDDSLGTLAQGFTLVDGRVTKASLYLKKSGTPPGNLSARIETNNAGIPSGTLVGTASDNILATSLTTGFVFTDFLFPSILLDPAITYWVVLQGDAAYKAGYVAGIDSVQWGSSNTGTYPGGTLANYQDGDEPPWTAQAGQDFLFEVFFTPVSALSRGGNLGVRLGVDGVVS